MSIQKRTVFYDDATGVVRFNDWALVTTTLGTMAEPFSGQERRMEDTNFTNFDFTDEINRIDEIRQMDIHKSMIQLSGGDAQIHGGTLMPRVGP